MVTFFAVVHVDADDDVRFDRRVNASTNGGNGRRAEYSVST